MVTPVGSNVGDADGAVVTVLFVGALVGALVVGAAVVGA